MENRISKYLAGGASIKIHVPNKYNGGESIIDFSNAQSFISDAHKIVVGPDDKMDLIESMARSFVVTTQIGTAEPNAAHFINPSTKAALCMQIARYSMLSLLSNSSISRLIRLRSNDLVTIDRFHREFDTSFAKAVTACRNFHNFLLDDLNDLAEYMKSFKGANSVLCLIANAMSRKQNHGHNWITPQLDDAKSTTSRIIAIAAADREEFKNFMTTNNVGHDFWHFFPDESIYAIADGVTGWTRAMLVYTTEIAGDTHEAGTKLKDIFKVGEAATDRWPPGELGKAALILTADLARITLNSITLKAGMERDFGLGSSIQSYKVSITRDEITRDYVQEIKTSMGYVCSFCWGYLNVQNNRQSRILDAPSLVSYAAKDSAAKALGEELGTWIRNKNFDDAAALHALEMVVAQMAAAFRYADNSLKQIDDVDRNEDKDQDYDGNHGKILVNKIKPDGADPARPHTDVLAMLETVEEKPKPRFYGSGKPTLEEEESAMSPMAAEMRKEARSAPPTTAEPPSKEPSLPINVKRSPVLQAFFDFMEQEYPGNYDAVTPAIVQAFGEFLHKNNIRPVKGEIKKAVSDWLEYNRG